MTENVELLGRPEWSRANALGRPFVVYKFAATLDGRVAASDGTSRWITSCESRAEVHLLRAGCHATIVGSGTQQMDDPDLAVRDNSDSRLDRSILATKRQPWRVVVDSNARTCPGAKVLNDAAPTLIAVAEDADARHLETLATVVRIPRGPNGLRIDALLSSLYARGARAVLLEGGPTLAGSFVAAGLIDRVISYIAAALLGAGTPALGEAGITTMADILRLQIVHLGRIGPDVRIIARPNNSLFP